MKIPDNTLRRSHLQTYGITDMPTDLEFAYAGCPALYRRQYVDETLVEPESYALGYGSMIHDALYLAEQEDLALLPDTLDKAWSRTPMPLDQDAYHEAVEDLQAFMERGGLNLSTIAVEQKLTMPLMTYKGVEYKFGGTLDWLGIDPNDAYTIYVADYKTNRTPPSQDSVDRDGQFTGYGALVRHNIAKYLPDVPPEEVRIVLIMEAIKWYSLQTMREDWQYDEFLDWARAMARRIIDDEEGAPVLNDNCGSCSVKFDCPEFAKLPGIGETLADRMSITTDRQQRAALMQQAQIVARSLTGLVKEVQAELKTSLDGEGIVVGGLRYAMEADFRDEFNLPELQEVLGDQFYSCVNMVKGRLEAAVKQEPTLKPKVEPLIKRVPVGKKLSAKKERS